MFDARATQTWKMDDFPQKLKKVVRIVLYRLAISQSDCRKTGPYQLPYNMMVLFRCKLLRSSIKKCSATWPP